MTHHPQAQNNVFQDKNTHMGGGGCTQNNHIRLTHPHRGGGGQGGGGIMEGGQGLEQAAGG